jgi:hypothetical protein
MSGYATNQDLTPDRTKTKGVHFVFESGYHLYQSQEKVTMLKSKCSRVRFGATLLMSTFFCGVALNAQEKPRSTAPAVDYRIAPGDVIQISVWEHQEVTRVVRVNRDGNITLPLANTLKVSGLSAMNVAELLRSKLKPTIPNPQVTVIVTPRNISTPLPLLLLPSPQHSPQYRDTPSPKCCVA